MVTFTEIKCVEKTDGLIIGIYGTLAPQSTYGVPTKARLRAIEVLDVLYFTKVQTLKKNY